MFWVFFSPVSEAEVPTEKLNWYLGPIEIENQFAPSLGLLSFTPESPEVLEEGESELRASFAWSNSLGIRDRLVLDYESRVSQLKYRHGLSDYLQLGVSLPVVWTGGGILDRPVDEWHSFWGLPVAGRDRVPDSAFTLRGDNRDGSEFDLSSRGFGFADLSLELKYLISKGSAVQPASALSVALRLPTGGERFGRDLVDLRISLSNSKEIAGYFIYFGGAYLFQGEDSEENLSFRKNSYHGFISFEVPVFSASSVTLGASIFNQPLQSVVGLKNTQAYFDLGFIHQISEGITLESLLRENITEGESSVDFSFLFGLRFRG